MQRSSLKNDMCKIQAYYEIELCEKRGRGRIVKKYPFPQTHCSHLLIKDYLFLKESLLGICWDMFVQQLKDHARRWLA